MVNLVITNLSVGPESPKKCIGKKVRFKTSFTLTKLRTLELETMIFTQNNSKEDSFCSHSYGLHLAVKYNVDWYRGSLLGFQFQNNCTSSCIVKIWAWISASLTSNALSITWKGGRLLASWLTSKNVEKIDAGNIISTFFHEVSLLLLKRVKTVHLHETCKLLPSSMNFRFL
jgi:hypothetical protein